jgi:NADH dehydrogenase
MDTKPDSSLPHIVIIGGGFGGLYAAQSLRRAKARVTVIDRRNFHLFQPLLYQVATGGLSPANIAAPLRDILKRPRNTTVLMGSVEQIHAHEKRVVLGDGASLSYDYLVVAAGVSHNYFGHDEWAHHAPGLKTIEDATEIRGRVLSAFEAAERESNPEARADLLRFVVVGGGPTGVELAGALGEIAHQTLKGNFRRFNPASAEILLIEAGARVVEQYPEDLSAKARQALERLGVTVLENARVTDVSREGVSYTRGGETKSLKTRCVLWAAGVRASPLGALIARETGVSLDRAGRVEVRPDLTVPGCDSIYVVGDLAVVTEEGRTVPGVAPAAMQEGRYVARHIIQRLRGAVEVSEPFQYRDRGSMATIGRSLAIAHIRGFKFSGFIAWLMWVFVHIIYLVEFTNRVLVFIQWGWNYFTRNRSARLITGNGPAEG